MPVFLLPVWAWIKSPLGLKVIAGVAAVLLVLGALGLYGHHEFDKGVAKQVAVDQKILAQAEAQIKAHEATAQTITDKVATDLGTEKVQIVNHTVTLTKKVPVYVTAAANAKCVVPVGFVSLYNAAAAGGKTDVAQAPGGSVDAPSGVSLSDVLNNSIENFGVAYDWHAEAVAWRTWYAKQKAAWDKP